jgi:hypothetical protein
MSGMHAERFSIPLGEIDIVLHEQIFNKQHRTPIKRKNFLSRMNGADALSGAASACIREVTGWDLEQDTC